LKKIMFFLPSMAGGGAEKTLIHIMNGLSKDKYIIHFLIIDSPKIGDNKDEYQNMLKPHVLVKNLKIPLKMKHYPKIFLKTIKALYEIKPDIIFSTVIKANVLASFSSVFYFKNKALVLCETNNRSNFDFSLPFKIASRISYNNLADAVVTKSQGLKNHMVEFFGTNSEKVKIIYNPIDLVDIKHKSSDEVELNKTDKLKLVSAGRLEEQKDYPTLLRALKSLREERDFVCYILGKGSLQIDIQNMIDDYGLTEHVLLKGFQSNPYRYFKWADIFILHSKWEGFGNVILEAMAVGTPVISSDCDYGPEEIIGEEWGLLFKTGDAEGLKRRIIELADSEDQRISLSKKGKSRVKDFSIEKAIREYESLFDSFIF
jgi:glycosyltransferase involved in cell wall biosynthesis